MDNYKELSSELLDDKSEEFNKYLERIREHYVAAGETDLDIYEMSSENPAVVIGSMMRTRDGFISKSASTVEADIRELFGYKQIIMKPMRVRRRKPKKVTKKPAKKLAKAAKKPAKVAKKGHKGGNDDHEADLINDFEVATNIQDLESDIEINGSNEQASMLVPTSECIICTLVMCGDEYVPGAIVLALSIHKKIPSVSVWCMYTSDVSLAAIAVLEEYFDKCIEVPIIEHEVIELRSKKQQDIYGSWISKSFTKWNIFNPELFPGVSQVLFMDADMLVIDDISDVFKLCNESECTLAATFSSPWTIPFATHGENPYYHGKSLEHGEIVNHDDIKKGLTDSICPIASMVLVRPNAEIFAGMMTLLAEPKVYGTKSVSTFDEQMLAQLILKFNLTCKNIHQSYNWLIGKDSWLEGKSPKTYHYYNIKPWQREPQYDDEKIWHEYAREIISKGDSLTAQWFKTTPMSM